MHNPFRNKQIFKHVSLLLNTSILVCSVIAINISSSLQEVPFGKNHKPGAKTNLEDINPKPKCQAGVLPEGRETERSVP